jgi:hypothetical protein
MVLGIPSYASAASSRLSVILSKPDSVRDADAGKVVVTIKNNSAEPLFLPDVRTPLSKSNGHILGNFLEVRNDQGEQANFIGIFAHIPRITMDFYTRIEPGQSLTEIINLASDYDLSGGGHFRVSYDQPFEDNVEFDEYGEVRGNLDIVKSNVLDIWVSASLAAASKHLALAPTAISDLPALPNLPELSCKAENLSPIFSARMTMASWLSKAEAYLENLYETEEVQVTVEGKDVTQYRPLIKPDFKYQYWFGAPGNDPQIYASRPKYNEIWDRDDFYPFKQLTAIKERSAAPDFHYSCGCPAGTKPTVAATSPRFQ